jgi:hypothetical protein
LGFCCFKRKVARKPPQSREEAAPEEAAKAEEPAAEATAGENRADQEDHRRQEDRAQEEAKRREPPQNACMRGGRARAKSAAAADGQRWAQWTGAGSPRLALDVDVAGSPRLALELDVTGSPRLEELAGVYSR